MDCAFFARLTNPNPRKSARKWDKMSTRAFVLFLAMAFAVAALSLSALFEPTVLDPLIEEVNAPIIAQLEIRTDLDENPDQSDCADCGADPGLGYDPDAGTEPGPGMLVVVDPAVDAEGWIGTIWRDGAARSSSTLPTVLNALSS